MPITTGDTVTLEYTGRLKDGTVFDTSRRSVAEEVGMTEHQPDRTYEALTVDIGTGQIIKGLEEALLGMEEGEETTVEIPPEKAYGKRLDARIVEYDTGTLTQKLGEPPTEGMAIEIKDHGRGYVSQVDSEVVHVDFNHELAGEPLEFDIEIIEV